MCRQVDDFDPYPHVFPMDTLLDLVQRVSREHLVDVDVIAEECKEDVLSLGL